MLFVGSHAYSGILLWIKNRKAKKVQKGKAKQPKGNKGGTSKQIKKHAHTHTRKKNISKKQSNCKKRLQKPKKANKPPNTKSNKAKKQPKKQSKRNFRSEPRPQYPEPLSLGAGGTPEPPEPAPEPRSRQSRHSEAAVRRRSIRSCWCRQRHRSPRAGGSF